MSEVPTKPITGPAVWQATDLAGDRSWERRASPVEVEQMRAGLAALKAAGLTVETARSGDFPAGPELAGLAREVVAATRDGRGFIVLRGLPTAGLSVDDVRLMYWGFGTLMGVGLSQDGTCALVADVKERHVVLPPGQRGYGSKRENPPHIDLTDIVGLLCVRQAPGGAKSTLSSSGHVFNRVLAEHPEWLPRLAEGFAWDRRNEHAPWEPEVTPWKVPVFSEADGQLTTRFNRPWIQGVNRRQGSPPTDEENAMFDFIEAVARANHLEVEMAPGDVYFASNHTVFHGRAAYEEEPDWSEAEKRLFLRLWLNVPGFRAFADEAVVRHGQIAHGNLGWTNAELAAGLHRQPGAMRSFGIAEPSRR